MKKSVLNGLFVLTLTLGCKQPIKLEPNNETSLEEAPIERLVTMFTGEFDNIAQMRADQQLDSLTKEEKHGRLNRIFVRVDAPKVGKYVLVGTTRYNGYDDKPWYFDKTEFLVWTFTEDEGSNTITMSPQKFKDLEARIPYATDPEKLSGFGPEDLETGTSGAICQIVWTPTENGFTGKNKPCKVLSTTTGKLLNFDWSYELHEKGMYADVRGLDDEGNVVYSTPGNAPYQLDRIN